MADDEELAIYDEVEIEDMTYDKDRQLYHYPCPCGDRFEIAIDDLRDESNDIAVCPSCSLMIRVIYEVVRKYLHSTQSPLLILALFRKTYLRTILRHHLQSLQSSRSPSPLKQLAVDALFTNIPCSTPCIRTSALLRSHRSGYGLAFADHTA